MRITAIPPGWLATIFVAAGTISGGVGGWSIAHHNYMQAPMVPAVSEGCVLGFLASGAFCVVADSWEKPLMSAKRSRRALRVLALCAAGLVLVAYCYYISTH